MCGLIILPHNSAAYVKDYWNPQLKCKPFFWDEVSFHSHSTFFILSQKLLDNKEMCIKKAVKVITFWREPENTVHMQTMQHVQVISCHGNAGANWWLGDWNWPEGSACLCAWWWESECWWIYFKQEVIGSMWKASGGCKQLPLLGQNFVFCCLSENLWCGLHAPTRCLMFGWNMDLYGHTQA